MGKGERIGINRAWREEQILRSRSRGERDSLPGALIDNAEAALRTAFALHDAMRNLARREVGR